MSIRVVNIKTSINGYEYIGRGNAGNRWPEREASPLANPFHIGRDGTRAQVIAKYEQWLKDKIWSGNRDVLDELARLSSIVVKTGGVNLGCFCSPRSCHGDVIKRAIEEVFRDEDFV